MPRWCKLHTEGPIHRGASCTLWIGAYPRQGRGPPLIGQKGGVRRTPRARAVQEARSRDDPKGSEAVQGACMVVQIALLGGRNNLPECRAAVVQGAHRRSDPSRCKAHALDRGLSSAREGPTSRPEWWCKTHAWGPSGARRALKIRSQGSRGGARCTPGGLVLACSVHVTASLPQ